MKTMKIVAVFIVAILIGGIPSAHAVLGIRIARKAIMAREAAHRNAAEESQKANLPSKEQAGSNRLEERGPKNSTEYPKDK